MYAILASSYNVFLGARIAVDALSISIDSKYPLFAVIKPFVMFS